MIFTSSYSVMAAALFVVGMCSSARWTIAYVYLMEFLTEEKIKTVGPFVNASAALAFLIGAFILQFITQNAAVLEYTAAILTIVCVVSTIFFLPESPKWLVNQDRIQDAKQSYGYIAEVNGRDDVVDQIDTWKF